MPGISILLEVIRESRLARAKFLKHCAPHRLRLCRTLRFEPLEDRRVLATFTVTNLNDATVTGPNNAPGTLRQAIYDANVSGDPDTIQFAANLSGDLKLSIATDSAVGLSAFVITTPVTIQGNAAGITIKRDITAPEMRPFRVALGGDLTLNSINVTGGITRGAAGTSGQNGGSAYAGAIYNQGTLQIISSALYANDTIGGSAGVGGNSGAGQGGAVYNDGGAVVIRNSTLSGNSALNCFGPVVERSFGGSIYSKNGSLTIDNSTFTNGSAASGREIYVIGIGAGQTATAQIRSSIIGQAQRNPVAYDLNATDDLGGQIIVTGSQNLIRFQNLFHSITVSSDDPMLAALAANGGPTQTHELLAGSPAIDQGSNPLNLVNDQRGASYVRVVGGIADVGAYEVQTVGPALPGDYGGDHVVDAADFVLWRKTKGADVPQYSGADGNGSGVIDDADYDIWRGNFGAQFPGSASVEVQTGTGGNRYNDLALIAAIAQTSGQFSASSNRRDTYPSLGSPNSQPISRRARDAALMAVAASHALPSSSAVKEISSDDELGHEARVLPRGDRLLLLNAAL